MKMMGLKSAIFVAATAFAFAAYASIEFKSSGATLRLADANGAVESLIAPDGSERVVAAKEAFTLQLLDGKGEATRLKSSEFAFEGYNHVEHVEHAEILHDLNGSRINRNSALCLSCSKNPGTVSGIRSAKTTRNPSFDSRTRDCAVASGMARAAGTRIVR